VFGISKENYLESLGPNQVLSNMLLGDYIALAELFSSGKSGSFFYYTSDGKFLLKTISKSEFKFLQRLL